MTEAPILECRGLTKTYGSHRGLEDFSVALPTGRIIGLLGPNGSGKTTLIKLCAGLLRPTSGQLYIDGMPVGPDTKSIVSYLPERICFDVSMTVEGVMAYYKDFYADFDEQRAKVMLEKLNIDTARKIKELSKGTREKVQLVLVMSRRAKLYLLDEPIGGVDPATRDYILSTIISNYSPDSSVIISTHLISDVENILDEFMFINEGKLTLYNNCDNVRRELGKSLDRFFREVFRC